MLTKVICIDITPYVLYAADRKMNGAPLLARPVEHRVGRHSPPHTQRPLWAIETYKLFRV